MWSLNGTRRVHDLGDADPDVVHVGTIADALGRAAGRRDRHHARHAGQPTTGPLFVTRATGTGLYEAYAFRLVRRLARAAAPPAADALSPHSLRHAAITDLLDATGGHLRDAQDLAGHADHRATGRYDRARNHLDRHDAYLLARGYTLLSG